MTTFDVHPDATRKAIELLLDEGPIQVLVTMRACTTMRRWQA